MTLNLDPKQLKVFERPKQRLPLKQARFKVALLGNVSAGKTSLLNRIISDKFSEYSAPTIGGDIFIKSLKAPDVQLLFHDTSGNERFGGTLLPVTVANASAILLVYDSTNREAFDSLNIWLERIKNADFWCGDSTLIFLVGTKIDLAQDRQVPLGDAREKAKKLSASGCIEVSSKTGENVDELLGILASKLTTKRRNSQPVTAEIKPKPKDSKLTTPLIKGDLPVTEFTPLQKFKIAILGERAVGKTSILTQFLYNSFDPHYQSTIGIDFFSKNIYNEGSTVRLQLWDTAGQERFRSLIPGYIRSSSAAIIVYDVSDRASFREVKHWEREVRLEKDKDVVVMLAANKVDLRPTTAHCVTTEEGEARAKELNSVFIECSAKTGYNVQTLFQRMASVLTQKASSVGTHENGVVNLEQVDSTDEVTSESSKSCLC